ncbi:UDP-N-acetylmuramoyl-L-alanine--D-glutamate ligase [Balneola sp. MJW-20]|uniref:UDP-N-acetylmuramoyl-L-alanine--D-glutamate ligase n=1 Tax=Gracilimonas aurantiaca TaxID=3234185 RepID=UPI0034656ACE
MAGTKDRSPVLDHIRTAWNHQFTNPKDPMTDIRNKHIVVIGAARSGIGASLLLKEKGADVYVTEAGTVTESRKKVLKEHSIAFEDGGHSEKALNADFAVVSPGVPTKAAPVQHYLNAGKKVYSEIEVASWFTEGEIIAITGSNGKTTVTRWLDHLWTTAGVDHTMAGNIGYAFSEKVLTGKPPYILEVSSFQLDHIESFKPKISMILNITPDHLDRYDYKLENYAASKFRISENQNDQDTFIYHYDDELIRSHAEKLSQKDTAPKILSFSSTTEVEEGIFVRDNNIIFKINNTEERLMAVEEVGLPGQHNLNNGLATALAARAAEIKNEAIRESLRSFTGVEHRLEEVRTVDGVKYINDSKATNVNAVWFALDSFNIPVVLILGGRDKGNDYTELIPQIRSKVHTLIAIGESRDRIEEQLGKVAPNFVRVETMGGAVRSAQRVARRGEVVLLSPACASFDMFDSYEHRGIIFKEEVNKL